MDKGAAARETANLEAKGYLTRKTNPQDARSQLLFATVKAQKLKNSKAHIEAKFYAWLLDSLSPEERQQFAALLEVLYRKCKRESQADFITLDKVMKEDVSHA